MVHIDWDSDCCVPLAMGQFQANKVAPAESLAAFA